MTRRPLVSANVRTLGEATPVIKMLARSGVTGKSATQMRDEAQARADAQPMRVQCGHCPWSVETTAGLARAAFAAHLAAKHADVVRGLPKRKRYMPLAERAAVARKRGAEQLKKSGSGPLDRVVARSDDGAQEPPDRTPGQSVAPPDPARPRKRA